MRSTITTEELNEWYTLRQQIVNGYHLSAWDKTTLIRLNHLVLEASSEIHNDNMMSKSW
jgi:hypothetical protein